MSGLEKCIETTVCVRMRISNDQAFNNSLNTDGITVSKHSETFRIIVLEQTCKPLPLDKRGGSIYRSPSAAAISVTGSSVDGW